MHNTRTIWFDFDNVPHVAVLNPIAEEMSSRGYNIFCTARDMAETVELLKAKRDDFIVVGGMFNKSKLKKITGTCMRALHLAWLAHNKKICCAVSHGSRSAVIASFLLGIPSVAMYDYEYVNTALFSRLCKKVLVPDVISNDDVNKAKINGRNLVKYPGFKENIYISNISSDPSIYDSLGIDSSKIVITVRPPSTTSHYHAGESSDIFIALLHKLASYSDAEVVFLPRSTSQKKELFDFFGRFHKKIIIPTLVVDGLDLIWHSDLVISGGGTMIREAAILRVPAYSIFKGRTGAVDRSLAGDGRLIRIGSIEDIAKIRFVKRRQQILDKDKMVQKNKALVNFISDEIVKVFQLS